MAANELLHLALVNQLISEKDRLILEKDDLIASKDKMWRKLHKIITEKDREIERLSAENKALQEAFDTLLAEQRVHGNQINQDQMEMDHEHENDGNDTDSMTLVSTKSPTASPNTLTIANGLGASQFVFTALVKVIDDENDEVGAIENVAKPVLKSIQSTFEEIDKRHSAGKIAPYPSDRPNMQRKCAWKFAMPGSKGMRWTTNLSGKFACITCFNAKRACVIWQGKMRWQLLPLPPEARDRNVTWKDTAFYIYRDANMAGSFPGVWQTAKATATKKTVEYRDEEDEDGP